jgi:hypothetical protein
MTEKSIAEIARERGGIDFSHHHPGTDTTAKWQALIPLYPDWLPQSLAAIAEARERLERIDREADNG